MPVDRLLPNDEARDLIALVRDIADKRMAPIASEYEKERKYPEGLFCLLYTSPSPRDATLSRMPSSA